MKSLPLFIAAGCLALVNAESVQGRDTDSRLILPEQIAPVELKENERNPFERRVELKTEEDIEQGVELSEEDRVRRKFNSLQVMGGTKGKRVLLADMILEEGRVLGPVLPDQTIELVVTEISANEVELTWLNDLEKKRPRTIIIPYDLSPRIGVLLSGQTDLEGDDQPIITERIMQRAVRPEMPTLKARAKDGSVRELEAGSIVGQ